MNNSKGSLLILTGFLALAAAIGLTYWNLSESRRAGQESMAVVEFMLAQAKQPDETIPETAPSEAETSPEAEPAPTEVSVPLPPVVQTREMTVTTIDGRDYIGVLTMPTLNIELPIISQWTYEDLRTAPCRYSGSLYDDHFVIAAHNYASHFGKIRELRYGDPIFFTDMDGVTTAYAVAEILIMKPTDIQAMVEPGYPLSLFTCTVGGQSRVTIRCSKAASP